MEINPSKAIGCKDATSSSGSPWALEDERKGWTNTATGFPFLNALALALAVSKLMGFHLGSLLVCPIPVTNHSTNMH